MRQWKSDQSVMCQRLVYWLGLGPCIALSLVLTACGNKGPLRMPDEPDAGVGKQKSSVAAFKDVSFKDVSFKDVSFKTLSR